MKPTVISLYSGAGGLDYGFEAAGFDTRATLEFDHDCCESLRASRRWSVIERSIFDVSTKELLGVAHLRAEEPDLVIGGPPCQPFSKAGYWANGDAKRLEDPRADTLSAYMRVIEEARPRAFLLENVEGLAYSGKDEGLKLLLRRIDKINRKCGTKYKAHYQVLNAADYGVPQLRNRFFLVAARDGAVFTFPAPTHAEAASSTASASCKPYTTAWDAMCGVTAADDEELTVRGKWAGLLPSVPEGFNYLWHTSRGGGLPLFGWRRRYWTFLLKLAKNRPSWTIQAQPGPAVGPFHWDNRRLSVRELCRLQTFPDDVRIIGGRTSQQKQIGNAVPSLLAEVLGRAIRKQLLGHRRVSDEPVLMPPCRAPYPEPRSPEQVPREFRKLVGDHSAHPGTGKGHAAMLRTAVG
ncbi:MAG TPA: DNA cytosine methyltransferase [Planctomycetota bacterium]|nr:DNA cytosine methyltransferase [Planctomycetota bacterium]